MDNYYKDLPENFKEDYVLDAKKTKVAVLLTLAAFVFTILPLCCFIPKYLNMREAIGNLESRSFIIFLLILCVSLFAYIVIHELTHGIVYKLFTHEKLTYGFTLTVAYCGVPNLYVSKKVALFAILAPFTVYTLIFLPIAIFATNVYLFLGAAIIFAVHFGGCVGDLYGTLIILFRYKGKKLLVNDTGPKQSFYIEK